MRDSNPFVSLVLDVRPFEPFSTSAGQTTHPRVCSAHGPPPVRRRGVRGRRWTGRWWARRCSSTPIRTEAGGARRSPQGLEPPPPRRWGSGSTAGARRPILRVRRGRPARVLRVSPLCTCCHTAPERVAGKHAFLMQSEHPFGFCIQPLRLAGVGVSPRSPAAEGGVRLDAQRRRRLRSQQQARGPPAAQGAADR